MIKYIFWGVAVAYLAILTPITLAQAPSHENGLEKQVSHVSENKPLTRDEAIALIKKTFADAPKMVDVAKAESQLCHPNWLVNPKSSARGCFQILKGTFEDPRYGCVGDRMEHRANIECARKIYDKDGTTPWDASKNVWSK